MDRFLGVLGIAVSALGVVASFRAATPTALGILALGFGMLGYSIWALYFRPPILTRHIGYRYEFADADGKLVNVTRAARVKISSRHVTTLWARSLTSTGQLEDFTTNLGRLSTQESTGGGVNVRVDFERALKPGSEINWVLRYSARGSFTKEFESVSLNPSHGSGTAELAVTFHANRLPATVRKTLFLNDEERQVGEPLTPSLEYPVVAWQFRPRRGGEYSLHWRFPSGLGASPNKTLEPAART